MSVAIIGGTGIYSVDGIATEELALATAYGPVQLFQGRGDYGDLYFIPRHGTGHTLPPHKVNYRANIAALQQLGVNRAVGIYAIGSITDNVPPGEIGLVDQFIDMTHGRESTFYNGGDSGLQHTEMSEPYCKALGKSILAAAREQKVSLSPSGTYLCCSGPRFETAAEIRMYKMWGADYAGMTAATETTLARERGIHFAGLVYSINWAAGIKADIEFITRSMVAENKSKLLKLAVEGLYADAQTCNCEYQPVF